MIGGLIGTGVGLFSSIFGGINAADQAKKAEAELKAQKQSNEDWYKRRYNEDYTQTAEAQSLMTKARDLAREQIQSAAGRQAVMGGTTQVDDARKSANALVSDTLSDLAVVGAKRKDDIENQYRKRDAQIADQYMEMYTQNAANNAKAASEGMKAGMGLLAADYTAKKETGKDLFSFLFNR